MNELIISDKRELSNIQKAIIYFFIYSFLGWSLEVIFAMYVERRFVNRGFLLGPICPIYGIGALILIGSLRNVKGNRILKKLLKKYEIKLKRLPTGKIVCLRKK